VGHASSRERSSVLIQQEQRLIEINFGARIHKKLRIRYLLRCDPVTNIQVFGVKKSQATRAAERFFKERRVTIQLIDLQRKPISAREIKRFVEQFGWTGLLDVEGKAYVDAGLKYLILSDSELMAHVEKNALLLRLPLVRSGTRLSVGQDEASWKAMLAS
jgi:arsenate reductase (glutaredoxin)